MTPTLWFIAWWLSGFLGTCYWWTRECDLGLGMFLFFLVYSAVLGPLLVVGGWLVDKSFR